MRGSALLSAALCLSLLVPVPGYGQPKKGSSRGGESTVLVVVNGHNIAEAELQRVLKTRQVPANLQEKYRQAFLEELVDAHLMRNFLASKKIVADKQEVDRQVQQVQQLAGKRGGDPDKELAAMGYTKESLRDEFALPLAWKKFIDAKITGTQLQKFFDAHRQEFDGTKVRARQILIKVPSKEEQEFAAAEEKLATIRQQIVDQEITFEDAAREYSDSPSRDEGGDVGLFPYSGKMPSSFSHRAFELKAGEISQPFRSTFGVHLCQVTERKPGDLSLEDVRDQVVASLSQELWKQTVADLRKSAKIEWKVKSERP